MNARLVTIALLIICVLLVHLAYRRANAPISADTAGFERKVTSPPTLAVRATLESVAVDRIAAKPLFYASRRPFVPAAEKSEGKQKKSSSAEKDFRLIAIIRSPVTKLALIENRSDKKVARLRIGQPLGEWVVAKVNDGSVVLNRDGKSETLQIAEREN